MRFLRKLLEQECGASAIEYAVMLAMVAAVVIGSVSNMTAATANSFNESGDQLESVLGP